MQGRSSPLLRSVCCEAIVVCRSRPRTQVRLSFPAAGILAVILGNAQARAAVAHIGTEALDQPFLIHWSFQLVLFALLIAAGVALWNEQTRRTVRLRTTALREEVARRERIEHNLRAHQSLLANAQRAARMGSWERDFETNRIVWSEEMYRIFGLDPITFPGTYDAFLAHVHPADRSRRDAVLSQVPHGENTTSVEYRICRPDRTERIVLERGDIVRDEEGKPLRKFGMIVDVTEQRLAERTIKEKDQLLRMAGHLGRIGGWVIHLPARRVVWSDVACTIHEMPAGSTPPIEEVIDSYADEYREPLRRAFEACVGHGRSFEFEARLKPKSSGPRLWVRIIGEAGRDERGEIVRVEGAIQDVTDRKALEQQFLRAQRQESIGTLAGGIAHDLNNVLTPILMSIDLLRLNVRDADDLRVLDTIEGSARRGADMVRQVLAFARGAPGTRVPTQARHLIRDIERIVHDTFPKSIGFEVSVDDDLGLVLCDPTQIHQVLLNLCVNARDAMPEGGVLGLRVSNADVGGKDTRFPGTARAGRHIRFEVSDTGTGIPAELREKIFDPFFTTKDLGKGTGLGLSTVANIVRAHGGQIHVTSELKRGSTFLLFLPAADGETTDDAPVAGAALERGSGETVLVVDDDDAVRIITRRALESLGYRVLEATNGADAVAMFVQRPEAIDVVVTDIMMPIMDGFTAMRTMLGIRPGLPIIAASGQTTYADPGAATAAGARHFLAKPFTAETLLKAVRAVLADSKVSGRGSAHIVKRI